MSSNVNDRQVGGSHYSGSAQHWDWVADSFMGYHAGCATKYLTRSLKKHADPTEDWEKALHFVEKLRSLPSSRCPFLTGMRYVRLWVRFFKEQIGYGISTKDMCEALNVPQPAVKIIHLLSIWKTRKDLDRIITMIQVELSEMKLNIWEDDFVV